MKWGNGNEGGVGTKEVLSGAECIYYSSDGKCREVQVPQQLWTLQNEAGEGREML